LSKDLSWLIESKPNPNIPPISPGDTVKVSIKLKEGERERTQLFQGVVIGVKKGGMNANFTVRHVAYGIGVERTFFFQSPLLDKVEVVQHARVRRAKLYYLRGLSSKATRAKLKAKGKVEPKLVLELEPEPEVEPKLELEPEPEVKPKPEE